MTARVAPPVEHTKKPLDHTVRRCLPQKKEPNLFSRIEADLDLSLPMILDGQTVGGASSRKWICSYSPLISVISHLDSTASFFIASNSKSLISNVSI